MMKLVLFIFKTKGTGERVEDESMHLKLNWAHGVRPK